MPLNDITSPTGKIGGAAQKRLGTGAVLHHVTMSYDMDGEKMVQVLRIGREKISDKGIASAAKRVDPLRSQTGLTPDEIIDRMVETFRGLYGLQPSEITDGRARARRTSSSRRSSAPRRGCSACRDERRSAAGRAAPSWPSCSPSSCSSSASSLSSVLGQLPIAPTEVVGSLLRAHRHPERLGADR